MKSEGFGLLRAKRKNSRKWLEGYYVRALETAGNNGVPAVRHYIIFQKANGSGRVCRAEINPDTLCRCTGIRDKNLRLIFEDERNVNTDEIIGNIFDRPKMLKCRRWTRQAA